MEEVQAVQKYITVINTTTPMEPTTKRHKTIATIELNCGDPAWQRRHFVVLPDGNVVIFEQCKKT